MSVFAPEKAHVFEENKPTKKEREPFLLGGDIYNTKEWKDLE